MKAKFAYCSAAALLAGGLLASSALAQETSSTPKLAAGHYLFDAYETGIMPANCPFQAGNRFAFNFVYSTSKNSTMRVTATDSSGSEVVVVSVPKKPSTGPWSVTYTASVYGQNGVLNGTWTGTFTATGVPADTESIAISLQLTTGPTPSTTRSARPRSTRPAR